MNKGIHSRGYLPHWDFAESVQAITFGLDDSVPASVICDWKTELVSIPDDLTRQKELHRRIARYEDAGHGSSVLKHADCAAIVQNKLIAGHPDSYRLLDWCIMPNHVYVLCKLGRSSSQGEIVRSWKGGSSIAINRLLNRSGPFWMVDYFDRFIRDFDHLQDCRTYIRNNPIKAGLCEKPEDWPYSSAGIDWNPDAMERGL